MSFQLYPGMRLDRFEQSFGDQRVKVTIEVSGADLVEMGFFIRTLEELKKRAGSPNDGRAQALRVLSPRDEADHA